MKSDIRFCGETGCDGIVIGMLNPYGTVDRIRNGELVEIARQYGMGVTFHRTFDRSNDLFQAMEDSPHRIERTSRYFPQPENRRYAIPNTKLSYQEEEYGLSATDPKKIKAVLELSTGFGCI